MTIDDDVPLLEKLHSETALIAWSELQRFFAQGVVINVAPDLDMIELAVMLAEDRSEELKSVMDSGKVGPPNNELARAWFANNAMLWSVVVAPFVLVQDKGNKVDK